MAEARSMDEREPLPQRLAHSPSNGRYARGPPRRFASRQSSRRCRQASSRQSTSATDAACRSSGPPASRRLGVRGQGERAGRLGGALFLVLLLRMLNTFGVSTGVRLVLTGLIIVAVTSPPQAARGRPGEAAGPPPETSVLTRSAPSSALRVPRASGRLASCRRY